MTRLLVAASLLLGPLLAGPAAAQDETYWCDKRLNIKKWRAKMNAVDTALAAYNLDFPRSQLERTFKELPCLDHIVLPSDLARFARQQALMAFYDQDELTAVRWGMLMTYTAPGLPWDEAYPEDHPFRQMLALADEPPVVGPDDMEIAHPRGGVVFIGGIPLEVPRARAEVPNLVQILDKQGVLVNAYWQDGSAFHEELLAPSGVPAKLPEWYVPEDTAAVVRGDVAQADPVVLVGVEAAESDSSSGRGKLQIRVGRLGIGGGMAVVAGGLYTVSALSTSRLDAATNSNQLAAARTQVNALTLGAGALAIGAVGVGITAFVSADSVTVGARIPL